MPNFTYAHKRGASAFTDGALPAPPPAGTCSMSWRAAFKALEEKRRAEGKLVLQPDVNARKDRRMPR